MNAHHAVIVVALLCGVHCTAAQEPSGDRELRGRFGRLKGDDFFEVETTGERLPVRNVDVPDAMRGILVDVHGRVRPDGPAPRVLDVVETSHALENTWEQYRKQLPEIAERDLEHRFVQLDQVFGLMQNKEASATFARAYVELATTTLERIGAAYLKTKAAGDPTAKLLELYVRTADDLYRLKAQYGRLDIFAPATYRSIYQSTDACVAVAEREDGLVLGSGVLVGKDIVVTCSHVIRSLHQTDLEVRFNFEMSADGKPETIERFHVGDILARGADYAILRVDPAADGTFPAAKYPAARMSVRRVPLDEALYVVGHPNGEAQRVADNAFTFFPYRATPGEFGEIEIRTTALYGGLLQAVWQDVKKKYTLDAKGEFYVYVLNGVPTFGADCDTFNKNSGSPVFRKSTHEVVGLLYAGSPDESVPYPPGWRRHERVLPIEVVADALIKAVPDWKDRGVVITGR